jgi:uncharacterized protein YkwD
MSYRRLFNLATAAAFALTLLACGDTGEPAAPPPPGPEPPALVSPAVAEFVDLVNAHRTSMGLAQLTWDAEVAAVAQAHSQDMVARGFFSHTNPDGESPFDRLRAAGIAYSAAGENIAYGYPTPASVLAAWLGSDGHRANIENANYTHHGVGLAGTDWTHLFIRSPTGARGAAPATDGGAR